MAIIQDGRGQAGLLAVETKSKSVRVSHAPRGNCYSVAATGVIPTAAASGSTIASLRNNPNGTLLMFIERMRVQFTTTTAFTTQVAAGRRVGLYRGSGATPSGGTSVTPPQQKDSTALISQGAVASGGDFRVVAGSAISTTNVIYEANSFREIGLAHMGAAGANYEVVWEFHPTESSPIILQPGQLLAIRNPVAFDAGGAMQVVVNIDWHESVAWNSTTAD